MFAPGHLGELTQVIDFALVDAVLDETGTPERRLRVLPSRVVVYFVLALALFERCSYRVVWSKLTAGLGGLPLARPAVSSLSRARRRIGSAPLRRLFETLAGPGAYAGKPACSTGACAQWRSTARTCTRPTTQRSLGAIPSARASGWGSATRCCGCWPSSSAPTRAVLAAGFGPDTTGELSYARQLLDALDASMLLLADAGFDCRGVPPRHRRDRRAVPAPLGRPPPPDPPTASAR
jgi:hypothetical protein